MLSRSRARRHAPHRAVHRRAPPYAGARAGLRPAVRVPSRGSRFPQATLVPMRLEVPPPYRGRPHPEDHRSVRCRTVRDGCLKGDRSSRCARVPPLLPLSRPCQPASASRAAARLAAVAAAGCRCTARQPPPKANQPPKPSPRLLKTLPLPSRPGFGDTSPEFRRIAAGRAPGDPIVKLQIFLRANPQRKGTYVRV
jgi:hypothetical protein